jgi:hypothetical protein
MRLAAGPDVYDALARHFGASAGSTEAAPVELIHELVALLCSKGYSTQAAAQVAASVLAGQEPLPPVSRRFAALHGHTP